MFFNTLLVAGFKNARALIRQFIPPAWSRTLRHIPYVPKFIAPFRPGALQGFRCLTVFAKSGHMESEVIGHGGRF
ncbi:MAG: hypothetical protein DRH20_07190 [Deltaproteobacteria bacterium]|nr:MAG: hypothetical protein DRH20_07190 [Deltaproteobacteria bacterium]